MIIINGQTGDFISGGHLPKDNCGHTTILSKHFGLWKSLIFKNEKLVKDRINQHFNYKRKNMKCMSSGNGRKDNPNL